MNKKCPKCQLDLIPINITEDTKEQVWKVQCCGIKGYGATQEDAIKFLQNYFTGKLNQ